MNNKNLIVKLDDNKEYSLINKMQFEGKNYVYLIELNNFSNILIGEVIEGTVKAVADPLLLGKLFVKFGEIEEKDTE